jgi:hypothetical protein
MRKLSLVVALSLSLLACGRQEKAENPFGRTNDPSREGKEMTEKEFKDDCSRKKGYLREGDTICYHVPHKFTLTDELKKTLEQNGSLNQLVGTVTQGAMLWGEVKGGQKVFFDLNGAAYTSMADGPLGKTPLNAGRLTIRIEAGNYQFINAYVAECFNRAGSVACPPN